MLRALQNQLETLANDKPEQFHEEVRKRLGKKATENAEKKIRDFIMMTPQVIARLYERTSQHGGDSTVKELGGFALTYLYNPKDFISEVEAGLFGYLDDAYVVARSYEMMLYELSSRDIKFTQWESDYLAKLDKVKQVLTNLIPVEKNQIETMIDQIMAGKYEAFEKAFT